MTRYVAFLRAVNVGGHAVFKMDVLVRNLEKAGLHKVSSYRQSGNIIFDSDIDDLETLKIKVSDRLGALTGVKSDVFLFSCERMRSYIQRDPFHGKLNEGDRAFATFMSNSPASVPRTPLPLEEGISLIGVVEDVAFSVVLKDVGSGPVNDLLERKFGVRATTRNWSTVIGLVEKAGPL